MFCLRKGVESELGRCLILPRSETGRSRYGRKKKLAYCAKAKSRNGSASVEFEMRGHGALLFEKMWWELRTSRRGDRVKSNGTSERSSKHLKSIRELW